MENEQEEQIIAKEIYHVTMGLLCKHLTDSSPSQFSGNVLLTSISLFDNLFKKLNRNNFNISNAEFQIILVTLIFHTAQLLLAYQRAQENQWNEKSSLAEAGCHLISATAPAMITYFQQCRGTRRDVPINNQDLVPVNDNIEKPATTIKYKKDL